MPDACDWGDYYLKTKYKSITKTSSGYTVKIKKKEYVYDNGKEVLVNSGSTYIIKLKKKGDSFITKSIAMK